MTPPLVARALVAAVTPPHDYESVAGDLYEEYTRHGQWEGRSRADRWYWSQAIRSMPSLLSYSRARPSFGATITAATVIATALVAMLLANELIADGIYAVYRTVSGIGAWPFFLAGWADAAFFGAMIAALLRMHGARIVLIASIILVAAIAIPIALGFSSPLSPATWLLLLGAIPSMNAGGAAYQVATRRYRTARL
ncbi:MAG: hypothetical protein GIX03_06745 [Candidatus Eremiobacteraeota bacterium]|nr:hypothetical protein [Candidatus Eremiobacteraeota bacterium]MBC5802692.1 hypothetical protein [Candidatus Eremiobacteraeota bacterium]MBC5821017.1 hypothetical protein [Candidatus Eremiobacteraeota bacterium]